MICAIFVGEEGAPPYPRPGKAVCSAAGRQDRWCRLRERGIPSQGDGRAGPRQRAERCQAGGCRRRQRVARKRRAVHEQPAPMTMVPYIGRIRDAAAPRIGARPRPPRAGLLLIAGRLSRDQLNALGDCRRLEDLLPVRSEQRRFRAFHRPLRRIRELGAG